ncbi:MAG: redoxin domain-containing protein [Acidimicrobiia bacterium]
MGVSPWLWVGVAVVVVAAVVLAILLTSSDNDAEKEAGEIGVEVTTEGTALPVFQGSAADAAVGQPAPVVTGVSPEGDPVTIGGAGPQILVFLAHYCPHCQVEVPEIVAASGSPDWPDNVEVTGITTATDDNRPNYPPSAWLDREDWPWPVMADDADSGAAGVYGISAFPYMVFIDADGNVALRTSGELGAENFLELADALGKGEPLATPGTGGSSGA